MKRFICLDCNIKFEATYDRHHLDYCPKCKRNAVDLEKEYCRIIGNVKGVKE